MTAPDYTHIALVLDRSGSMGYISQDMNGGIRAFLDEQAKLPGKLLVDVTTFDTTVETPFSDAQAGEIPTDLIRPRGGTALFDAVGVTVTKLGEKLAKLEEDERPEHVIVVIVTDGYENSSTEWTKAKVLELVNRQQDEWNWNFVFLGANIDSAAEGGSFGLRKGQTLDYAANAQGVAFAAASVSHYATITRSGLKTTLQDAATENEKLASH